MRRLLAFLLLLGLVHCAPEAEPEPAPPIEPGFADFVEPDFPFVTTTLDAGGLAPGLPERNLSVRAVVVQLGDSAYAAFDPDLLRMAVAWTGEMMSLETMAQVSYHEAGNKRNGIPRVLGRPVFATGAYPGWTPGPSAFVDPRAPGPNPEDPGRGPLPDSLGRWNGLYTVGDGVVLSYTVGGADILEHPSRVEDDGEIGIARTFRVGPSASVLTLVAAESDSVESVLAESDRVVLSHHDGQVTVVGLVGAADGARLRAVDDRYVVLDVPPRSAESAFTLVAWRGESGRLDEFAALRRAEFLFPDLEAGGTSRWSGSVTTPIAVAADTAALVVDRIARVQPNRWRRNVRPADLDFYADGSAAVVTFEGDVWRVTGFGEDALEWTRFASGLYEPMSVAVVDDELYVYGREGIVRLHDRDGDGEADFYESFADVVISNESREWPLSMVEKPGGGFYISRGGAVNAGPKTSEMIMPGFRNGSRYSGTVVEISPAGEIAGVVATGFREPYLGIHPQTGMLTASDQQGNFVPTTPIYHVRSGGFYGVPATAHRPDPPPPTTPITWTPHQVDPSGAEQVWITSSRMGPLDGALVHLSYGRPTAFVVFADSLGTTRQGGIVQLPVAFPGPVMKGRVHPESGLLYLIGFQVWGSQAEDVSGFYRLRPTDRPLVLPTGVETGREGIVLHFGAPLDPAMAADPARYNVLRWNYRRTEQYGSGHFTMGGEEGQEIVPVAGVQVSDDGRSVLLVLPDMREVMQLTVDYDLAGADGTPAANTVYLTANTVEPLALATNGFAPVDEIPDLPIGIATAAEVDEPTVDLGSHLFQELGCVGCHSTDGTSAGKLGPTLQGLFGRARTFTDGTTREADAAYLHQSILDPSSQIVEGFEEGMPIYRGVLSDGQVESLVLFIRSL